MTTRKGIFNALVGVVMVIIIFVFQLIFLFILSKHYGNLVGLFRVLISFLAYLTLTEGGLGLMTIFSLYRPLQNHDYEAVNDIVNTTRKNYQHNARIYFGVVILIAIAFGLLNHYQIFTSINIGLSAWEFVLIFIALASKELSFFYFSGAYQHLIQADQKSYLNRLVFIFSEIIMYIMLIALVTLDLPMFVPFIAYGICGFLKALFTYIIVKIEYPWLQHKKWIKQTRLLRQSWWIDLSRFPDVIIATIDIVLITIFLKISTTTVYAYYLLIATAIKNIALILINSFREVFGYWIAKAGRIRWSTYTRFEMYAYMIAAFCFICQFFISPYLIAAIYGVQAQQQGNDVFFNYFLVSPTFIFFLSFKNAMEIATEPGRVIVNATVKHKETLWSSYIQALIILIFAIGLGTALHYSNNDEWCLYMIIFAVTIGWMYRLISIWYYIWRHLTYNSDLRYIVQNILVLFFPIIAAVFFNYFYLNSYYPPKNSINNPKLTVNISGYVIICSFFFVLFSSMAINYKQFWAIFNVKKVFKNCFNKKEQKDKNYYHQELKNLLKQEPNFNELHQTVDFTLISSQFSSNIDEVLEKELKAKQVLAKANNSPIAGIYKIRG